MFRPSFSWLYRTFNRDWPNETNLSKILARYPSYFIVCNSFNPIFSYFEYFRVASKSQIVNWIVNQWTFWKNTLVTLFNVLLLLINVGLNFSKNLYETYCTIAKKRGLQILSNRSYNRVIRVCASQFRNCVVEACIQSP